MLAKKEVKDETEDSSASDEEIPLLDEKDIIMYPSVSLSDPLSSEPIVVTSPDNIHAACLYGNENLVVTLLQETPTCMYKKSDKGLYPIHSAIQGGSLSLLEILIRQDKELLKQETDNEDTVLHVAVKCENTTLFAFLHSELGEEAHLDRQNAAGITAPQIASRNGNVGILEYLQSVGYDLVTSDKNGNTLVSDAAIYGQVNSLKYLFNQGCDVDHVNKTGYNPFLLGCRHHNLEVVELLSTYEDTDLFHTDLKGNTALLVIFDTEILDKDMSTIMKLVDFLKTKGFKFEDENYAKENFLLKAIGSKQSYKLALEMVSKGMKPIIYNSDGMSLVHVLASKGEDLERVTNEASFSETLVKISRISSIKNLINERVQSGLYADYTCLHFACEASMETPQQAKIWKSNIMFFLKCGLSLADKTSKGESAVDIAVQHRNVMQIMNLFLEVLRDLENDKDLKLKMDITGDKIVGLIDDVTKGFNLATKDEARSYLIPFCDAELRGKLNNALGTSKVRSRKKDNYPIAVRLLALAFQDDSEKSFQSILSLGLWKTTLKRNYKRGQKMLTFLLGDKEQLKRFLPILQNGFNHIIHTSYDSNESNTKTGVFDLSYPSVLGIAIRSGRTKVAINMLLAEQFEIIPACLQTIIECQRLMGLKGVHHTDIHELHDNTVNMLLNVFHYIYVGANESEKRLIYAYIMGRINFCVDEQEQLYESGPKFLTFGSDQPYTIYEMLETAKQESFFATDCISTLVDKEWEGSAFQKSLCSPKSANYNEVLQDRADDCCFIMYTSYKHKFGHYCLAFVFFMLLLICYIINQKAAVLCEDILVFIYGFAYFCQEINKMLTAYSINSGSFMTVIKKYFLNLLNILSMFGIICLFSAIIMKLVLVLYKTEANVQPYIVTIRLLLSLTFLCWGMRALQILKLFQLTGPSVSILRLLIKKDLLPFLFFYFIAVLAFGLLYYTFLQSEKSKDFDSFVMICLRSMEFAFYGKTDNDSSENCVPSPTNDSCPRSLFYIRFFIHFFHFIVNLTLQNLLIAKINLTISNEDDNAYVIWRSHRAQLLKEMKVIPFLTPPFNIVQYFFIFAKSIIQCRCIKKDEEFLFWKQPIEFSKLPNSYRDYIKYQALALRNKRHLLTQTNKTYGSPYKKLEASISNDSDELKSLIDSLRSKNEEFIGGLQEMRDDITTARTQLSSKSSVQQGRGRQVQHQPTNDKAASEQDLFPVFD